MCIYIYIYMYIYIYILFREMISCSFFGDRGPRREAIDGPQLGVEKQY